jgi:hypothetical protein
MRNRLLGLSNAALEWQGRNLEPRPGNGCGLSTRRACSKCRFPTENDRRPRLHGQKSSSLYHLFVDLTPSCQPEQPDGTTQPSYPPELLDLANTHGAAKQIIAKVISKRELARLVIFDVGMVSDGIVACASLRGTSSR